MCDDGAMNTDDLQVLKEVERLGSLRRVALSRHVAISTIKRRLDGLEAELALRLVDRTGTGVILTAAGKEILKLSAPVLSNVAAIERASDVLRNDSVRAAVVVTSTEPIISEILAPALPDLWTAHPEVTVDLLVQNDVVSLANREADLAIRMTRPKDGALLAKKLPAIALGLFTSENYLAGRTLENLKLEGERIITYDDSYGPLPELDWLRQVAGSNPPSVRSGSTRAMLRAVQAGAGIALLPVRFAERAKLVRLTTSKPPPERVPWLLADPALRRLPHIAAVHEWIVRSFEI